MKYIKEFREGMRAAGIYLCKFRQSAVTKNGKPYENVILQDKTGTIDAKIWEPNSVGIDEFDSLDYIDIVGDVTSFAGALQVSIKRLRRAGEDEYNPADYLPASRFRIEDMYQELMKYLESVKNPYLHQLLESWFTGDQEFIKRFQMSSACHYFSKAYPILNRDLLITAAILHDVGKTKELSAFPANDYTDDGQLLGHIMIGAEMVHDRAGEIPGFPEQLENELKHCILAHHGELEYGSPKKPALAEALALNLADNADARMETLRELFENSDGTSDWLGYSRIFESNIRRTGEI